MTSNNDLHNSIACSYFSLLILDKTVIGIKCFLNKDNVLNHDMIKPSLDDLLSLMIMTINRVRSRNIYDIFDIAGKILGIIDIFSLEWVIIIPIKGFWRSDLNQHMECYKMIFTFCIFIICFTYQGILFVSTIRNILGLDFYVLPFSFQFANWLIRKIANGWNSLLSA